MYLSIFSIFFFFCIFPSVTMMPQPAMAPCSSRSANYTVFSPSGLTASLLAVFALSQMQTTLYLSSAQQISNFVRPNEDTACLRAPAFFLAGFKLGGGGGGGGRPFLPPSALKWTGFREAQGWPGSGCLLGEDALEGCAGMRGVRLRGAEIGAVPSSVGLPVTSNDFFFSCSCV